MKPFAYTRAANQQAAIQAVAQDNAKFLAGGTNLIDLMKENVEQPSRLVDINRLELTRIVEREGGVAAGRAREEQRHGKPPPRARTLSARLAGDSRRRECAVEKCGDERRQSDAAHALLLLLRRGDAL